MTSNVSENSLSPWLSHASTNAKAFTASKLNLQFLWIVHVFLTKHSIILTCYNIHPSHSFSSILFLSRKPFILYPSNRKQFHHTRLSMSVSHPKQIPEVEKNLRHSTVHMILWAVCGFGSTFCMAQNQRPAHILTLWSPKLNDFHSMEWKSFCSES